MEIMLTLEGERVMKQVRETCTSIHQGFLGLLPENERQNMITCLEKLQLAIKNFLDK
jgi:hypothetical protein